MRARCTIFLVMFLAFITTHGIAQTAEISQPVQLTFSVQGTANASPCAVWNGSEWAVAYTRIYGELTTHILRCGADGEFLGGHELFSKEKDYAYRYPQLTAYEKGWALTVLKRHRSDESDKTIYFHLLNKNARKTGVEAKITVGQHDGLTVASTQPIPVGDMFVIFYNKKSTDGFTGIHVAYIDRKGKRVVPDVQITNPTGKHHILTTVTPTSEGFALLGMTQVGEMEFRSAFFMMVNLDGTRLTKLTEIDNHTAHFHPRFALWNGKDFTIAGTENIFFDDDGFAPFTRLLHKDGSWNGGLIKHEFHRLSAHLGLGYDGSRYVAMYTTIRNGTVWCYELDANIHPKPPKVTADDGAYIDYSCTTTAAGSMTGFFPAIAKVQGGYTTNIYYTRIDLPHEGKPDVAFFNTKVHEFNGKKYALLDWVVAGCTQVKMKTKGGRWTLSPSGFHAAEIGNKAKFRITASNDSGTTKAKVKVTP